MMLAVVLILLIGACLGVTAETTTGPYTECPQLPQPNHGNFTLTNKTFNQSEGQFACNRGYDLIGNATTECSFGNWTSPVPKCVPVDCGNWTNPNLHSYVTYPKGTTFGSTAFSFCERGFQISSGKTSAAASCLANATWSVTSPPVCVGIACPWLNFPIGVLADYNSSYYIAIDSIVTFSCNDTEHALQGYEKITCLDTGQWSGSVPTCQKAGAYNPPCPGDTDSRGTHWNETPSGTIATSQCKQKYIGAISRRCNNQGKWMLPNYNCIREDIDKIDRQIIAILDHPSEETVTSALTQLNNITKPSADEEHRIYSGEIEKVTSILGNIAKASEKLEVTDVQTEAFLKTTSNLIDTTNTESWQAISQEPGPNTNINTPPKEPRGAAKILNVVSNYTDVVAETLNRGSAPNKTVPVQNLVLHVSKIKDNTNGISFPGTKEKEKYKLTSSFHISAGALEGLDQYSSVVYKNLRGIMSPTTITNGTKSGGHEINSAVVAVKVPNWRRNRGKFNLTVKMDHFTKKFNSRKCNFWNDTVAAWDGTGCVLKNEWSMKQSICECNHLTNFAILMSPWIQENVDTQAIDIISTVGCSVSLIALVATIAAHITLWRYVKSDRVILLMNLSVALIISYGIFIGGVDRTEDKDACTSVAVLLQYIYLVVFFIMLAEGIEIAVTVLYVFATASRLKWMLPCAWLIPAVIVGISLGATQLEGYGNEQFCWLSVEGGLIWAFVAPAFTIILVNFVLLILVIGAAFRTVTLAQKSATERTKAGVKCLCVLLPIMGCTWVIGIFYVNQKAVWIQYVFAVCNSLQGLVIFIFHCVFNKQIRTAIEKRKKKYADSMLSTASTSKRVILPRAKARSSSGVTTSTSELFSTEDVSLKRYKQQGKASFRTGQNNGEVVSGIWRDSKLHVKA